MEVRRVVNSGGCMGKARGRNFAVANEALFLTWVIIISMFGL